MRKNVIVYTTLLAVGALIGWFAGQRSPSSQIQSERVATAVCAVHGIDVDLCTRCNSALIPRFTESGDWCVEHNVPESQCELCNPGLARAASAVCPHGLSANICARCHPELIASFKESGDWCAGHDVPESQCELCNPGLVRAAVIDDGHGHSQGGSEHSQIDGQGPAQTASGPGSTSEDSRFPGLSVIFEKNQPLCPTDGSVIQFASIQTADRAGIRAMPVTIGLGGHRFEAPAETVFDQTRTTMISSTIPVTIRRWRVEPGTPVDADAPLADVESPQMASLQGAYLKGWSDWRVHARERERAEALLARGLIDSAGYERTMADAVAAEGHCVELASQLRLAGLAESDLLALRERGAVSSQFTLRSVVGGALLERPAALGTLIEPGVTMAVVGDPAAIWVEADVRDRDLSRVEVGQTVNFLSDAGNSDPVVGTVIWISQYLDPHTRTGIVRVKPTRATTHVRAHQFGRLQLPDGTLQSAILVPHDAVQWEGCCNVVFVQESPERFRPRKVRLETGESGHYRVLDGLRPGESVVVEGSYLLKTELQKGSIGAGCCGLEAAS